MDENLAARIHLTAKIMNANEKTSSSESKHESDHDDYRYSSGYLEYLSALRSERLERNRRSLTDKPHSDRPCYRRQPSDVMHQPYQNRARSCLQGRSRSHKVSRSRLRSVFRRSRSIERSDRRRKNRSGSRSRSSNSSCYRHCCRHRKSKRQFSRRHFKDHLNLPSNQSYKQANHLSIPYNRSEDHRYQQYRTRSSSSDRLGYNDKSISRCGRRRFVRPKHYEARKRHCSQTDSDICNDDPRPSKLRAMYEQRLISTCTRMTQTDDTITGIAGHYKASSVLRNTGTDDEHSSIVANPADCPSQDVSTSILHGTSIDAGNVDGNVDANPVDCPSQDVTSSILRGSSMDAGYVAGNVETNVRRVKNDNPQWHCYGTRMDCKICEICYKDWGNLVQHYVYRHPDYEVFPSRVTPQGADLLRDEAAAHQCEKEKTKLGRTKYKQMCYFCNETKSMERCDWINHLAMHSGYFRYRCDHCSIYLKKEDDHVLLANCKIVRATLTEFEGANVMAYLCDRCNYVRFDRTDIHSHMRNEHGADVMDSFKTVTFLRFPQANFYRTQAYPSTAKQSHTIMPPVNNNQSKSTIKNNNPDWHWLSAGNRCKICDTWQVSLTLHYVNVHPNSEVISSRIAPEPAAFVRNPKYVPDCEVVNKSTSRHRLYKQTCFFCNELKTYRRSDWINHMIKHTGYYTKQCDRCLKKIPKDTRHHNCNGTIKQNRLPQFDEMDLIGYVCNKCNFVRFDEKEIRKHLWNEHHSMGDFDDIVFLTFPNYLMPRRFDCKTLEDRMELRRKHPIPLTVEEHSVKADKNAI
ncbi:uncharacterized protein LOC119066735 [Bradysia coprophila]|uniref:uncharacterized protein LOC119066735 n=1 Tax=Bradysia coprophila TaxID=38358 RepID=UPI00187D771A|nr:uncharacterized protein LOC119066735 [Bradysia coprophila]